MKLFSKKTREKSGYRPFEGTPHANAQRLLKGLGRYLSKRSIERQTRYLLSVNHVYTQPRGLKSFERRD